MTTAALESININLIFKHTCSVKVKPIRFTLFTRWSCSQNRSIHSFTVLTSVQLPCNFFITRLPGGASVNIVPTKTRVPHRACRITLQQPRSSIWKPSCRYRSSVSNSVLLVYEPKNCRGTRTIVTYRLPCQEKQQRGGAVTVTLSDGCDLPPGPRTGRWSRPRILPSGERSRSPSLRQ